ncbi:FHA domain-containing protein [Pseudodonghicola xiamenensis]|nr:FHA domain-containing protein [Pseudodonghicola xiamenensis]
MRGLLDEKAAAKLLLAAAVIDFWVLYLLASLLADPLRTHVPLLRFDFSSAVIFLILLPISWVLSELILPGITIGRLALGLGMATRDGGRPSFARRSVRFLAKLSILGLSGLRWDRTAGYNRVAQLVWLSPMSNATAQPPAQWRLAFHSGAYHGRQIALGKLAGFTQSGQIRIGRDAAWANLKLPDGQISGRHCQIRIAANRIEIRDGSDGKTRSANGTFLGRKEVPPDRWVIWDGLEPLRCADVQISLRRT